MEIEDRNLVGVEYPGRVENVDNMVRTLGGLTNISKVVSFIILSNAVQTCGQEYDEFFFLIDM